MTTIPSFINPDGKLLINGNFDVWQRGSSGFNLNLYGADRWIVPLVGYTAGSAVHEQVAFTIGQTEVPHNPTYYHRVANTDVSTGPNGQAMLEQKIENAARLSGETVTFSVWVRRSNGTKITLAYNVDYGTGGSVAQFGNISNHTVVPNVWTKVSGTVTLPDMSGKTFGVGNNVGIRVLHVDAAGTFGQVIGDYASGENVDTAQAQLEIGSIPGDFVHEDYTATLIKCMRYYEALETSPIFGSNITGTHFGYVPFSVIKRVVPTITYTSINGSVHSTHKSGFNISRVNATPQVVDPKADAEL